MSDEAAATATELGTGRGAIQSVQRAAQILHLLADAGTGVGLTELSRALGLAKGTLHGILRTLRLHGMVEQDAETGRYTVGAALLPIGFAYLAASQLRTAALGPAHGLATHSRESVRVATAHGTGALIVHHVPGDLDTCRALDVGAVLPMHATALGKALLALTPDLLDPIAEFDLERYTPATITSVAHLRVDLDEVARRGWASSVEEQFPGIAAIAAPIAAADGRTLGAVELLGIAGRICVAGSPRPELVSAVIDCSRAIARMLHGPLG